jgi:ABC-2 type transport system ATP-binding protein
MLRAEAEAPSTPAIEVEDLIKVYGAQGLGRGSAEAIRAVDGVSFRVPAGEFFGFLGPNGSGKTTIIKIITTLLAPTSGRARVQGLDVTQHGTEVRRLIGYTGQSVGVDGELTGRENLQLMGRLYHLEGSVIRERVAQLLEVLQLTDAADRPAYTYSGGMRRRLDLGSGLVHHPRVLFLDEPTTGLDPQTRNAVWEYLRRLHREEKMTVFLTTQYMEEADQLCERLSIIDHGKIVTSGSPRELKNAIRADVITIRLPQNERFEAVRARALELAGQVPGVESAAPFDEGVTVRVQNGGAALLDVLKALEAGGVNANEVAVSHPTLDQVFLQHTGRAMKVEEVRPATRSGWAARRR